jgi:hypothetical protein
MKTIVCVKTNEVSLDLQKVRKYLISQGVVVLDFFEESLAEVHYVTKGVPKEVVNELKNRYTVETFSDET